MAMARAKAQEAAKKKDEAAAKGIKIPHLSVKFDVR